VHTYRWSKHVTKGHKELLKHIEKRTQRISPSPQESSLLWFDELDLPNFAGSSRAPHGRVTA
jgi:hypothetical protein